MLKPEEALRSDQLIGYCRRFLANYKNPRHVEFSEIEPKKRLRQVLKRNLRERYWPHQERLVSWQP